MKTKLSLLSLGLLILSVGCATITKRTPLPLAVAAKAQIPGIPNAAIWGDEMADSILQRLRGLDEAAMKRNHPALMNAQHHYLALSGGGAKGAFGAGLLCGWKEAGNRPEFSIVTGISTGGLSAPFAFLGHEYDAKLKRV